MSATLARWAAALDARSLRERLLVLVTLLVLLSGAVDLLLLQPLREAGARADQQIGAAHSERLVFQARFAELSAELQRREREHGPATLERLRQEVARVDTLLAQKSLEVISPTQMVALLREMFDRERDLTLVALGNAAPQVAHRAPASAAQDQSDAAPVPVVYRHALQLEFTGDFLKIVHYVKRLEDLDWQLAWDEFSIVMETYPTARARISLHTLSLDEDWIGA